jgi:hypothetical protein
MIAVVTPLGYASLLVLVALLAAPIAYKAVTVHSQRKLERGLKALANTESMSEAAAWVDRVRRAILPKQAKFGFMLKALRSDNGIIVERALFNWSFHAPDSYAGIEPPLRVVFDPRWDWGLRFLACLQVENVHRFGVTDAYRFPDRHGWNVSGEDLPKIVAGLLDAPPDLATRFPLDDLPATSES